MGKKKDYEDEDEDEEDTFGQPFDPFDIFTNPEKFFNSAQFKSLFKNIFKNVLGNVPGEFKNLSLEDIQKEFMKFNKKNMKKGPIVAGFNVNITPDGNFEFNRFGNIDKKPYSKKAEVRDTRVPLVEVAEEETQIIVVAEMPGVTKEDIELKADVMSLTISTKENIPGRKYYKEVALPSAINPDYAKARYTNGILEVKLKKPDVDSKKDIKID